MMTECGMPGSEGKGRKVRVVDIVVFWELRVWSDLKRYQTRMSIERC